MLGTTPAFVIFTSMVLLHEYPTEMGKFGIWLLVLGGYVLNIDALLKQRREEKGTRHWTDVFAPFLVIKKSRGMQFALLAALGAFISLNYDGVIARTANLPFALSMGFGIAGLGCLMLAWKLGEFDLEKVEAAKTKKIAESNGKLKSLPAPNWGRIAALVFFYIGSQLLMSAAYRESIVPYVGSMKRSQIVWTMLFALILLGEKVTWMRFSGAFIMFLGAAAMGLREEMMRPLPWGNEILTVVSYVNLASAYVLGAAVMLAIVYGLYLLAEKLPASWKVAR
jgi:drug/metabolite transporter (DMT)-like permease